MYNNEKYGKIFFIKTRLNQEEKFGILNVVNSNFDNLTSIALSPFNAMGVTTNDEVLEWKTEKSSPTKKQDYSFLISKPVYSFYKMKFTKILLNSSVCLGLDKQGSVLVWGWHKDGLLGQGYNVTTVEHPTRLETLRNITEIAMSESHAVVIDTKGDAYSWGSGKYGELGLDRSIYSPFPTIISTNRQYFKVWCSELITCFIDADRKFSFFGVIIKIYKGSNSSITLNRLLKDENNSNPNFLFQERYVYELESESFNNISIGNGFIGLLSDKGLLYTLDHSDNITILYSKYYVYSISVSNNGLFGLCRDNNKVKFPKNNEGDKTNSNLNLLNENNSSVNYYLCRWNASFSEKDVISDSWTTQLYKVTSEMESEHLTLIDSKNKDVLLLLYNDENFDHSARLNCSTNSFLSPKERSMIETSDKDNNRYEGDASLNYTYNDNLQTFKKHNLDQTEVLALISIYDDSYNMKYKRIKNFQGARPMTTGVVNKKKIIHVKSPSNQKPENESFNLKLSNPSERKVTDNVILTETNNILNMDLHFNSKSYKDESINNESLDSSSSRNPKSKKGNKSKSHRYNGKMNNLTLTNRKDKTYSYNNSYHRSFTNNTNNTFISNQLNENDNMNETDLRINPYLSIKSENNLLSPEGESLVQFYVDSAGFANLNMNKINARNLTENMISSPNYTNEEVLLDSPIRKSFKTEGKTKRDHFFPDDDLTVNESSTRNHKRHTVNVSSTLNKNPKLKSSLTNSDENLKSRNTSENGFKPICFSVYTEINTNDNINLQDKISLNKVNNDIHFIDGILSPNNTNIMNSNISLCDSSYRRKKTKSEIMKASDILSPSRSPYQTLNFINDNEVHESISKLSIRSSKEVHINFTSSIIKKQNLTTIGLDKDMEIIMLANQNENNKRWKNEIDPHNLIILNSGTHYDYRKLIENYPSEFYRNNNQFLYFTKILYRIISVFYKENKNEFISEVFEHLRDFSVYNCKLVLLKKFIHKIKIKSKRKFYCRWKSNTIITNAVSFLNSVFLKNIKLAFSFFKHYTKVFNLKKKYFNEFIEDLDKKLLYRNKLKFFQRLKLKSYYLKNINTISFNLNNSFSVIGLAFKKTGMNFFRRIVIQRKLMKSNINFFVNNLLNRILKLKNKFLKELLFKYHRSGIMRELVMKKHLKKIFFLKKSFKCLKKFSMRENENIYINFKLKKLFKIYFYKQKMKLIKMLYKWNINATKKLKPKLGNSSENLQLNDLRNRLRRNKIPGFNSSFISTTNTTELFVNKIKVYINKKFKPLKFEFMTKAFIFVIKSKIDNLCNVIFKYMIKDKFIFFKNKINFLPFKNKQRESSNSPNLQSSYDSRITLICKLNENFSNDNSMDLNNIIFSNLSESSNLNNNCKIELRDSYSSNSLLNKNEEYHAHVVTPFNNLIPKIDIKNINSHLSTLNNNYLITPKFRTNRSSLCEDSLSYNKKDSFNSIVINGKDTITKEKDKNNFTIGSKDTITKYKEKDYYTIGEEESPKVSRYNFKSKSEVKLVDLSKVSFISNSSSQRNNFSPKFKKIVSIIITNKKKSSKSPLNYYPSVKTPDKLSSRKDLILNTPPIRKKVLSDLQTSLNNLKVNKSETERSPITEIIYNNTENGKCLSPLNISHEKKLQNEENEKKEIKLDIPSNKLIYYSDRKFNKHSAIISIKKTQPHKNKIIDKDFNVSLNISYLSPIKPILYKKLTNLTNHRNNCASNVKMTGKITQSLVQNNISNIKISKLFSIKKTVANGKTHSSRASLFNIHNTNLFNKIISGIFSRRRNHTGQELLKRMMTIKFNDLPKSDKDYGFKILIKLYKRRRVFFKLRFWHRCKLFI